jgi:hypothetical protein
LLDETDEANDEASPLSLGYFESFRERAVGQANKTLMKPLQRFNASTM